MSLRTRFNEAAQILTNMAGNNGQNNQDESPPDQAPPAQNLPPPPYPGAKPRLQDKLEGPGVKEVEKSTWETLEQAKSNDEAQDDLYDLLMKHNPQVYLLLMAKKSAVVKLGHSPFKYISRKANEDEHHRCVIFFINDRTERGDPMAYAVQKAEVKK